MVVLREEYMIVNFLSIMIIKLCVQVFHGICWNPIRKEKAEGGMPSAFIVLHTFVASMKKV